MTEDGKNISVFVRPLGITASIITIIQGIAWSILALLQILIYNAVWQWDVVLQESHIQNYEGIFYSLYLKKAGGASAFYVTPSTLHIFACIYLPLSFFWWWWSAFQLWILLRQKFRFTVIALSTWIGITSIISIMDLLLAALVSVDYRYLISNFDEEAKTITVAYHFGTCGTLLTLAIRGFTLWIVNVIFIIILGKLTYNIFTNSSQLTETRNDVTPLRAYQNLNDNNKPDDPWANRSIESRSFTGVSNPAFDDINEQRPSFIRSHSFSFPSSNNNGLPPGLRRNGAPPPLDLNTPYIPDPDYTPPGTPSRRPYLKPALKQRSQYRY